jgi:putative transcriptional regulator
MCRRCAERLKAHETVAAALFETLEPVAMANGALDALFERIDQGDRDRQPIVVPKGLPGLADGFAAPVPAPVANVLARWDGRRAWRRVAGGIEALDLNESGDHSGTSVELMRLDPGRSIPKHDHEGLELTLVLQGAFSDENGRYGPGDVAVGHPGGIHRPVSGEDEVCICLAVTDGALRFQGALGLAQRTFGLLGLTRG